MKCSKIWAFFQKQLPFELLEVQLLRFDLSGMFSQLSQTCGPLKGLMSLKLAAEDVFTPSQWLSRDNHFCQDFYAKESSHHMAIGPKGNSAIAACLNWEGTNCSKNAHNPKMPSKKKTIYTT